MNRRTFLAALMATTVLPQGAFAQDAETKPAPKIAGPGIEPERPAPIARFGEPQSFSAGRVTAMARELASRAFEAPPQVPQPWLDLNYDQYKNILFDPRSAIWHGSDAGFEFDLFAPGLYFKEGIDVHSVEPAPDGTLMSREVLFEPELFLMTDAVPEAVAKSSDASLGFSGFRLRTEINTTEWRDEFLVFQGASYFRAVGRDQAYGLSARGLALGTGGPDGEEFPFFRAFWLEKPKPDDTRVVVHALLDSQSVAGAYTFTVEAGSPTVMEVQARLFPRVELAQVGIAPATSMFLYDETNRERFQDFRPAVHDSDGLMILNGAGERLWRKLANPKELQVSSFVDENPRGFGLMQRARDLRDFADLEAHYERRPSLWIEPLDDDDGGNWGRGSVMLVEIPADKEIYDNTVAFWRPREPLAAGQEHDFSYRLSWGADFETTDPRLRVDNTYLGGQPFDKKANARTVAIDFVTPDGAEAPEAKAMSIHVSSDGAEVTKGTLKRNPVTKGLRLAFNFYADEPVELRAQILDEDGAPASEVWLYRWTP